MMWEAHLTSGVLTSLMYCSVLNPPVAAYPPIIAAGMVGSLAPDIDCPGSTASRSIPVVTPILSWIVRKTSKVVYNLTKGPRDEDWEGTHRHLSHTVVFALMFGGALTLLIAPWMGTYWALVLGGALAIGCVTHDIGDSLTLSGCPFLWPLPIAGETWYELRPPRLLRFRTGGFFERRIMINFLRVGTVLLIPGVWPVFESKILPLVIDILTSLWHMVLLLTEH